MRQRSLSSRLKRRTTLTLPDDLLKQAEKIARRRNVNLSTVISEVLSDGLRIHDAKERSEEVLRNFRKSFAGLSEEETAILDGVILEPVIRSRRS